LAVWPAELPQSPLLEGLSFGRVNNKVTFIVEGGNESKERKRFTGKRRVIPVQLLLTQEQKDIFDTFYDTTLDDGVQFFTWKDFETGDVNVTYKFEDPQPTAEFTGVSWRVQMMLLRVY
ncbi:MAG: hypothetical protein MN733_02665, partial [Nitrososphaera sp.]|nr:hypothetical protein [Nitrososphaera sp.]